MQASPPRAPRRPCIRQYILCCCRACFRGAPARSGSQRREHVAIALYALAVVVVVAAAATVEAAAVEAEVATFANIVPSLPRQGAAMMMAISRFESSWQLSQCTSRFRNRGSPARKYLPGRRVRWVVDDTLFRMVFVSKSESFARATIYTSTWYQVPGILVSMYCSTRKGSWT